jgi:hypothetical protein
MTNSFSMWTISVSVSNIDAAARQIGIAFHDGTFGKENDDIFAVRLSRPPKQSGKSS